MSQKSKPATWSSTLTTAVGDLTITLAPDGPIQPESLGVLLTQIASAGVEAIHRLRVCNHCGGIFLPKTKRKPTSKRGHLCSASCRTKAYQAEKKAGR